MTEKTKIMSARVPNEVREGLAGYDMRTLLKSVYDLKRLGIIDIIDSEIVIPDNYEMEVERFEDIP